MIARPLNVQHVQQQWFLHVNEFARNTVWLHTPMRLYAEYGIVLFAAFLLLSWWLARRAQSPRRIAAALWAPVATLVAVGLNQPIVHSVGEARPFIVFPHALVLVARSQDASFPSDHGVMAGAVAAGVLLANRRLGLVVAVAAVLIAFARVYVGVHFPLDVVAGLVLGATVTILGHLVLRAPLVAVVTRLSRTRLRPLFLAGAHVAA
ncbi:MAG: Undecaprenyl-diphosphatase [Marmoricola sp.]|jgi:membrane-associated phospholipid phosphatase|nr:Undecaprenyl-diphosphatase [Marmoricola sp.]